MNPRTKPKQKIMYSIDKLLEELRAESGPPVISKEDYEKAKKEINERMEEFAQEWRAYMAYSREAAKNSYITF